MAVEAFMPVVSLEGGWYSMDEAERKSPIVIRHSARMRSSRL